MSKKKVTRAIMLDLDRCVGCYACAIACKSRNSLPEGVNYITVASIGPVKENGKMYLEFTLNISEGCNFCGECISTCPTEAIFFCKNEGEIARSLRSKKRYQLCTAH